MNFRSQVFFPKNEEKTCAKRGAKNNAPTHTSSWKILLMCSRFLLWIPDVRFIFPNIFSHNIFVTRCLSFATHLATAMMCARACHRCSSRSIFHFTMIDSRKLYINFNALWATEIHLWAKYSYSVGAKRFSQHHGDAIVSTNLHSSSSLPSSSSPSLWTISKSISPFSRCSNICVTMLFRLIKWIRRNGFPVWFYANGKRISKRLQKRTSELWRFIKCHNSWMLLAPQRMLF